MRSHHHLAATARSILRAESGDGVLDSDPTGGPRGAVLGGGPGGDHRALGLLHLGRQVLIFGHEPGGGVAPRCTPTGTVLPDGTVQTDAMKTFFFYDTADGSLLGRWVLPRDQTVIENCTLHNCNIVPLRDRYVVVSGNYQSGISVVDFTDPANAREIAFADPAPLSETKLILGGDWSSYWYDGRIYESDITRGLPVWKLNDPAVAGARKLGHLNPQTQEFTLGRR
jgi:hypothetical protein